MNVSRVSSEIPQNNITQNKNFFKQKSKIKWNGKPKNKKLQAKQESMNLNGGKEIKLVSTLSAFCAVNFYSLF